MTAAILIRRPAARPEIATREQQETDLVRLLALDRLAAAPRRLVCHWHRGADGRLTCFWERDLAASPHR